jgi:hypothetical protein
VLTLRTARNAQSRARSTDGFEQGNMGVQHIRIQPTASLPARSAQTDEKSLLLHPEDYAVVFNFANEKVRRDDQSTRINWRGGRPRSEVRRTKKKEEFTGLMVHGAWELLSPDLRCFWNDY